MFLVMRRALPPLSGRLLWLYRGAWVLLATMTLGAIATAIFDESMPLFVLGLRLTKSAILVAVAFVLFCKRPRDPVAAILALAFLCWTITSSVDFTSTHVLPMLLDRLRFLLFALALLLFPDGKWRPRWTRHVAVASGLIFMLGSVEAVRLLPTRLFLPLAVICIIAAIFSLIQRSRRTSSQIQQQQFKWVSFGLIAGVCLILLARACASLLGPAVALEAIFQLGIVLVALGFLVPLIRYRLYDAEAVISRSVGYAVLTAALVATFAGTEAVIELLGQQYIGSGVGQISGAIAAALAAVLLAPLNDRISSWAEQRFQGDLVQLKRHLPELLAEIPPSWSPRRIGDAALAQITDTTHATSAAIVIQTKPVAAVGTNLRHITQDTDEFPLQLPLRCHFGELRGVLLIGRRPDGSLYGKDETAAVEAILPALSRALLASLASKCRRRRTREFQRSVTQRLQEMSARLQALEQPAYGCG